MTRRVTLGIAAIAAGVVTVAAQGPPAGRFQHERLADVTTGGPQRLDIDVALLTGSQPFTVDQRGDRAIAIGGLGDLRLFASGAGSEIQYLLIPPSADPPSYVSGRILPITPTESTDNKTSGFEVDLQAVTTIDAIELTGIPAPFLKRFRLEGSGDRERWTQLVGEGTAFDLPAEQLRHIRIEFTAGPYRYLRVTWDDTNSGRVAPPRQVEVRRVTGSMPGPILRASVPLTRRQSEPGRSRFRLTLPAARLPIVALELTVAGGNLLRDARVLEASLVGQEAQPRMLGQARLTRVVRDQVAADALRIPITQPIEPQLDLVVDDGDNPPLALESVTAVFAELPWIYFDATPSAVAARYGDPRLTAPRYDLEAARMTIPADPSRAVWRPQPPVTLATEPEGLPMPETGSALAINGFSYARDIPGGAAGLIAVPLDVAVMAHSGVSPRQLRDLRIVDRAGSQVPYLLERRDEPLIADAVIERRALPQGVTAGSPRATSYAVRPPYPLLPNARLVLTTQARVFQRSITLGVVTTASDRQPARFVERGAMTWAHSDQETAAPSLTFPLPDSSNGELFLVVEEGDNQPLPIDKATLLMPAYAVRLFRPPNQPLRLIYGRDDLGPPEYDLQLLAPQVLGRAAEEVASGPEQALAEGGSVSTFDAVPPAVFWSVLSIAVIVLLGLVVRLMRREAI
jgi:hypothetical protein